MCFDKLIGDLMKGVKEADAFTSQGIKEFEKVIGTQKEIRVYVDGTPNFGHQATTVHAMKRMIDVYNYSNSIRVIYAGGEDTAGKLALLLTGLTPETIDTEKIAYGTCKDISFLQYKNRGTLDPEPVLLGLTGGADDTKVNLAKELKVTCFLRLQPYLWRLGGGAGDFVPNTIEFFKDKPSVNLTEIAPKFALLPFKFAKAVTVPAETWNWYAGQTYAPQLATYVKNAHQMIIDSQTRGDVRLWPAYGLHHFGSNGDKGRDILLTTLLSGLLYQQSIGFAAGPPIVAPLLNTPSSLNYKLIQAFIAGNFEAENPDSVQSILTADYALFGAAPPAKTRQKISDITKLIQAYYTDLDAGQRAKLVDPADVTPETISAAIKGLKNGDILFIPLGPQPVEIYNYLYAIAKMPGIFEGQGTSSLVINLGQPFLQLPKSGIASNNYPTVLITEKAYEADPQYANLTTELFRNILNYYIQLEPQANYQNSLDNINTFLGQSYQSGSPMNQYFSGLGTFFQQDIHDKLLLGFVAVNNVLHGNPLAYDRQVAVELEPVDKKSEDEKLTLQQVYDNLTNNWENGSVNMLQALPDSNFANFYKPVTLNNFIVYVAQEDIVLLKDGDTITKVTVQNATTTSFATIAFGLHLDFTLECSFVLSDMTCTSLYEWSIDGIPWIGFEKPGFTMKVSEGSTPVQGGVLGTLKGTGLTTEIAYPIEDNKWEITGTSEDPVSIATFYQIAGGINLVQSMPAPLNTLAGFGLTEAQFIYDSSSKSFAYMLFKMTTAQPWVIINNPTFSVTPSVNAVIYNPGDINTRKIAFQIFGQFKVGDGTITVSAQYPNFQLTGILTDGVIDLSDLVKLFGASIDLRSSVTSFNLYLKPETQEYSISADITADWPISIAGITFFTISAMAFQVRASKGTYYVYISGSTIILPDSSKIGVTVDATYETDSGWSFEGKQTSGKVSLSDLLTSYLGGPWKPPTDYAIDGLGVKIETKSGSWEFTGKTAEPWVIPIDTGINITGNLKMGYNGGEGQVPAVEMLSSRAEMPLLLSVDKKALIAAPEEPVKKGFFGHLSAEIQWRGIDLVIFYDYAPDYKSFGIIWGILTGKIEEKQIGGKTHQIATLQFTHATTLGSMVETMVSWATGSKFNLAAPWNVLNSISLNNLSLTYDFTDSKVYFNIDIGPINLGFATINKISLSYNSNQPNPDDNGVIITIDGSFFWQIGEPDKPLSWDTTKPEQTPAPPGNGNKYFDLRLLAMGQHITLDCFATATTVQKAIECMAKLPDTTPGQIPSVEFDGQSSWLIGTDFGVLKLTGEGESGYMLTMQIVFNDPNLYALRIAMAGNAAKIFKGLDFQIMYRQVSDSVGVYSSQITLPDIMRRLSVGVFTITLPVFGIEVYTNGDFLVDIGFPYNENFSRSFTVEAIIAPGIPVLGSAGFYFGKLSSATSNQVPAAINGTFNPVIVFGFGAQVGFGKSINIGILAAGFSLTVVGILEGVIAKWNPYQLTKTGESGDSQLQGEYYFWLRGTVGVIGKLYGTVNFAIIKADVNLEIKLLLQLTYASYASVAITVLASVEVSVSVKINLGLFKIKIHLSFSVKIKQTFTMLNSQDAPWKVAPAPKIGMLRAPLESRLIEFRKIQAVTMMDAGVAAANWNNLKPAAAVTPLSGYLAPALTAAGDAAKTLNEQQACYVLSLFIDSMPPTSEDSQSSVAKAAGKQADTSFELLAKQVLRWVIASQQAKVLSADEVDGLIVTEQFLDNLTNNVLNSTDDNPTPIPADAVESFMTQQFAFTVSLPPDTDGEANTTFFPMAPQLELEIPKYGDYSGYKYIFADYNAIESDFLSTLRSYFDELAVQVQQDDSTDQQPPQAIGESEGPSVATFILGDYFLLLARQMVQAAQDGLRDFKYPLVAGQTVEEIVNWVYNNGHLSGAYSAFDIFTANPNHVLTTNKTLSIGLSYTVQAGDSFESIAASFINDKITASDMAFANAMETNILKAGAKINYGRGGDTMNTYIVNDGDCLLSIAGSIGWQLNVFIINSDVLISAGLLRTAGMLTIPVMHYQALDSDTFDSIASLPVYENGFTSTQLAIQNAGNPILRAGATIVFQENSYTVQPNDSLGDVALYFSTSVNDLLSNSDILAQDGLLGSVALIILPIFGYTTIQNDSLQKISEKFDVSIELLSDEPANSAIADLFDPSEEENIDLAHLPQFKVGELIKEAQRTLAIQHLSGMASRYYMYGLRLPTSGIIPKAMGMWVTDDGGTLKLPPIAGLYALSGQQFPLPKITGDNSFMINLNRPKNLPWLLFGGKDKEQLTISIAPGSFDNNRINKVLAYTTTTYLNAELQRLGASVMVESNFSTYPLTSSIIWQNASAVTLPYGARPDAASALRLWTLPNSIINLPDPKTRAINPRFSIKLGRYDEATGQMVSSDIIYYGWGTTVEFTIKKIPEVADSPATKTSYELSGASTESIVFLERILNQIQDNDDAFASLIIGYQPEQTGGQSQGVQTDVLGDVTMGIAQVNLSTITRPPAAADKLLEVMTGDGDSIHLLNKKTEFIRLLWEASITRSGGFYLYYYNSGSNSGLPGRIFNDKGEASLSLILLYDKPSLEGSQNQLTNYMNTIAIDQAIDTSNSVVYVQSDPVQNPKMTISTSFDTSLADVSYQYFTNLADLAEDNAPLQLRDKVTIHVTEGVYEVPPDGIEPGGKLTDIASYFGTTVDQIKAANPLISKWPAMLPLYTSLVLPPIDVVVGTSKGGTTLQSISEYYGEDLVALTVHNKNVQGIFADNQNITIAGGPVTRVANVPAGVESITAQRPVPPEIPDDPEDKNFAEIFLQNNFSLLSYCLVENQYFNQSNLGLPIGQTTDPVDPENFDKIRKARRLEPGDKWTYKQSLPYPKFVKNAPKALSADLPDPLNSPYLGIGDLLQLDFGWVDYFGNTLLTNLSNPNADDSEPLNQKPLLTGYTDPLIGLGQWPSVSAGWQVLQGKTAAQLDLTLSFDASRYEASTQDSGIIDITQSELADWQKNAQHDLPVYRSILYQLTDPNGIALSIETSLLRGTDGAMGRIALTKDQKQGLLSWLESIYKFIDDRANGGTSVPVPAAIYSINEDIDITKLNTNSIFKLNLSFTIARTGGSVQGDLESDTDIKMTSTSVAAISQKISTDDGGAINGNKAASGSTLGIDQFSKNFQAALSQDGVYQLKVATGVDRTEVSTSQSANSLWAVRVGEKAGESIAYTITDVDEPSIFAPRPISNKLESRSNIAIYDYTTGKGIDFNTPTRKLDFNSIDLDLWGGQFFVAIDDILSPKYTAPIQIVGQKKGRDYLGDLLDNKEKLADIVKELMIPFFQGEAADPAEVREAFRQALLVKLSNAYSTHAGIQFQANVTADITESPIATQPPQLFGTITQNETDTDKKNVMSEITLTSPKLTLKTGTDYPLPFLLSAPGMIKGVGQEIIKNIDLDLTYQGSAIEHQIGHLTGIEGYIPSSWLSFVIDDGDSSPLVSKLGRFKVPLIIRSFPNAPTAVTQAGKPANDGSGTHLSDILEWKYSFTYSEAYHYPQDRVYCDVHFNVQDSLMAADFSMVDAFPQLAEFITVYPEVNKDLEGILQGIDASATDQTKIDNAAIAVESFIQMVSNVVAASEGKGLAMMKMPSMLQSSSAEPYLFSIQEGIETIDNVDALVISIYGKPPEGVGTPVVLVDPDKYDIQQYTGGNCAADYCYWYQNKTTKQPLKASEGQTIGDRKVVLPGLNILQRQDAISSMYLKRNEDLVDGKPSNEAFVYTTPMVNFPNPIIPLVASNNIIDMALLQSPDGNPVTRTLDQQLTVFFDELLKNNSQPDVTFQVSTEYTYAVNPKLAGVPIPIMMQPPLTINVQQNSNPGTSLATMISNWANAIRLWMDTNDPATTDAVLWFNLTVMTDLTRQPMPIVNLSKVMVPWRYIKSEQ